MAASVLVDTSFVVALVNRRDSHHHWAIGLASHLPAPWRTCEAVLSETFHLLGARGRPAVGALLRRKVVIPDFDLAANLEPVLRLITRYADVPMSFADACLVRMTERLADPVLLTTDADFSIYRRNGRHVIPCMTPFTSLA